MIRNRNMLDGGFSSIDLIHEPLQIDGGMTSELLRKALEPTPSIKRSLIQSHLRGTPAKDAKSSTKPKNDKSER